MFNVMLDRLPTEYNDFPINSDFRIGVQIFQALNDNELSDMEQFNKAYELLFMDEDEETGDPVPFKDENGIELPLPDIQEAQDGIHWFLSGWYTDNLVDDGKKQRKDMDYDVDQWRIFSAFLTQFGYNLNTIDIHFWVFMGLLSTLEECAFTRIVDIRTKKIDPKMKPSDKEELSKVKERYALEQVEEQMTPQEKADYDNFMKYAKKGAKKNNDHRNM